LDNEKPFKAFARVKKGDFLKKVVVVIMIALLAGCIGQKPQTLEWETDAQHALDKAKSEKKSLLLFFYETKTMAVIGGESQNPSEWMDKNVFSDPTVIEFLSKKFILLRLDSENKDNAQLASSYGGSVFPFFIVVSADGNVCKTFSGVNNAEAFLKKLEGCY